jgi:hypothetical protein
MNQIRIVGILFLLCSISGCLFGDFGVYDGPEEYPLPTIDAVRADLVEYPSGETLAAYYCPSIVDSTFSDLACEVPFGPAPAKEELVFFFDLEFSAGNNGDIPLPVLEILVALNLFEGMDQMTLGSTCVQLCAETDPQCTGEAGPQACAAEEGDIDSAEDLVEQAVDLLVLGLETGFDGDEMAAELNRQIRMIPPNEEILFTVRFGLGIDAMLGVLEFMAVDALDDWMNDTPVRIEIPYAIQGAVWVDMPYIGRFSVDYGVLENTWVIE